MAAPGSHAILCLFLLDPALHAVHNLLEETEAKAEIQNSIFHERELRFGGVGSNIEMVVEKPQAHVELKLVIGHATRTEASGIALHLQVKVWKDGA